MTAALPAVVTNHGPIVALFEALGDAPMIDVRGSDGGR